MDYWLDKILETTDQMKNEEVTAVKMLDLIRKMNLNLNEQLLRIDQQMNRRVTVMEVQMDSIERKLNLLDKDLREQYFSIGRRLDLLHLQLFKNDGEQEDSTNVPDGKLWNLQKGFIMIMNGQNTQGLFQKIKLDAWSFLLCARHGCNL